ncbi:uncharacterized protein N0V89_006931 [Didymosphaeria variabile]|uniref:NAD-dependent epimerase/dehydratase domain-containing protein n=1 Tax=Didymosphaeria variabile TaxID=1932322 RepID=A0A9W8XK33_9PLEO|nr:uncharacterized protein N0V89_006931 [Didymosphaeria variabile]KAJ4351588.1 hypothetical protein N0V89_006931 [Didymosphaeria variabile]
MHIFLTGGNGFIGKAVIAELLSFGHTVTGLARSDESAQILISLGTSVHKGSLSDLHALKEGAAAADAVIHLAFIHDFSNFAASVEIDKAAIEAMAEGMKGTGKPLIVTSGTLLMRHGHVGTEDDAYDTSAAPFDVRGQSEELTKKLAKDKGIAAVVVRLAPVVHGDTDKQFVPIVIAAARKNGVSAYIGDGLNRWPATHVLDAAAAFRLAVERKVPPGSTLHFVAEEGVQTKDVAIAIGKKLGLPMVSKKKDEAAEHFGWFASVAGIDNPVSSAKTKEMLGWTPKQPSLLDDIRNGTYFT